MSTSSSCSTPATIPLTGSRPCWDNLIARLDWAYRRAREAEQAAQAGRIEAAFAKWSLILKDYFPAYR